MVDKERLGTRNRGKDELDKGQSLASDDPRRGGKTRFSHRHEEGGQSNFAQQRIIKDLRNKVVYPPKYETSNAKWEVDATGHKRSDASMIRLPQPTWKDEISPNAFRQIPKITNNSPSEKGTGKRILKNRISWWP